MNLGEQSIKLKINPPIYLRSYKAKKLIDKFETQFAYGHREILLKYSNLNETVLLTGILQHGVGPTFTLYSDWPTPRVNFFRRSPLWVYSRVAAKELASKGVQNVSAIGSPWLYSKILDSYELSNDKNKIKYLVFPRHYSSSDSDNTFERTYNQINYWLSIAGSADLEICLHWSQFEDLIWQTVAHREGVTLKCAGKPNSPLVWSQSDSRIHFYRNLREIIGSATHCIFESFTSAIFYACDLGKSVGFFPADSKIKFEATPSTLEEELSWLAKNIPGIFNNCEENSTLIALSRELLGYEDMLSPISLSEVLSFQSGIIPKSFI